MGLVPGQRWQRSLLDGMPSALPTPPPGHYPHPAKVSAACDLVVLEHSSQPTGSVGIPAAPAEHCGLVSRSVPPPSDLSALGLWGHAAIFKAGFCIDLCYRQSDLT